MNNYFITKPRGLIVHILLVYEDFFVVLNGYLTKLITCTLCVNIFSVLFSQYGHVAYQIKENEALSNMQANILPLGGTPTKRFIFFLKWSCCMSI